MRLEYVLRFLKDLNRNNNRDWFEKNKDRYLEAKQYFEELVAVVLEELITFDSSLSGLDPKKLSFRIYRDVRFSKDKRPYKTNMGASFSPGGKLIQAPGYYVHLEPGNKSFVGGGIYMPDASLLAKIRQEIDYNGAILEKIMYDRKFRNTYGDFDVVDQLKTAPKGYPKDHPHIDWLRHKSYVVSKSFADREVVEKKFIRNVVNAFRVLKPLNDFLKEAIS